jgi:glycerol kinase
MVLALDQGTTSSRAILFDRGGAIRASAQREITQRYPKPGWVEHDPEEIWESQRAVMEEAAEGRAGCVAAIGITNQRETAIVWDRATGEPVYPAIVWQDRRTADFCEFLKADGRETLLRERAGLLADPYFAGTKVRWILDEVPGVRLRAERGELAFGTVDSWLVWKLTGCDAHVTDVSNASRTLVYNIHTLSWDEGLLGLLDLPASLLPAVVPSSGVVGEVACGSPLDGVPIAGMAGDQQAALFGQACFLPGMAKNTYGTGCFVLMTTGERPVASVNRLLTTVAWQVDGTTEYALEGSVFSAGAVVQWLRDGLGLIGSSREIEALAASVPDAGGVVLVPAFAGLGAPYWDPYARGTIVGLTRGTTAGHLARAALESIAFQSRDVLEAMRRDAAMPLEELRVDGGASVNDLLMQFQADVLGVPVVRPRVTETTALGAAYLAGLAVGVWSSRDDIAGHWQEERAFEPAGDPAQIAAGLRGWERAVRRAAGWTQPDQK